MAAFAQGSRSSLSYIEETTYGVTPSTPTFTQLPITSHTLDLTKSRLQGTDILPDRMPRVDRLGNRQVGGDIVADLRKLDYDPLLESAFMSAFTTNVLKVGSTLKSFSIEDGFQDISQYRLFTGCSVSDAAFSIKPNQMVKTTFTIVGSDSTNSTTTAATATTAESSNEPFDAYSGSLSLADYGSTLASVAIVTGIDFSIKNAMAPTFVVGSPATPQLEYGRATVEGTVTAYVEDLTLLDRFLGETETAFEVSVDDPTGSNPYTFLFPKAKFYTGAVPLQNEQSRMLTLSFVALYDSVEGTNLKLTRTNP